MPSGSTSAMIEAAAAMELGIIDRVCPPDDFLAVAADLIADAEVQARVPLSGRPLTADPVARDALQRLRDTVGGRRGPSQAQRVILDRLEHSIDADFDAAIEGTVRSVFANCGQVCLCSERVYVERPIFDRFVSTLKEKAEAMKLGRPEDPDTQMGPLCTTGQMACVEEEVALAVKEGGRILCGGSRPEGLAGNYFQPTVIECPRQDMHIVDTEMFGPVLSALRFKTEDEVVELANDTVHGLAAGIFTRDSARSMRMAKAVDAGIVWVNTYRVVSPIAEFGGIKGSGYGRESGFQAMYDYTRPKTIWMNTSSEPMANPFVMR